MPPVSRLKRCVLAADGDRCRPSSRPGRRSSPAARGRSARRRSSPSSRASGCRISSWRATTPGLASMERPTPALRAPDAVEVGLGAPGRAVVAVDGERGLRRGAPRRRRAGRSRSAARWPSETARSPGGGLAGRVPVPRCGRRPRRAATNDDPTSDGDAARCTPSSAQRVAQPQRQPPARARAAACGGPSSPRRSMCPARAVSIASASSRSAISVGDVGVAAREVLGGHAVEHRRRASPRPPGARAWTSGSSSRTCFIATATWFSPWNGTSPISISYSTTPSE